MNTKHALSAETVNRLREARAISKHLRATHLIAQRVQHCQDFLEGYSHLPKGTGAPHLPADLQAIEQAQIDAQLNDFLQSLSTPQAEQSAQVGGEYVL